MPHFDCIIRGGSVLVDGGLSSVDVGVIGGRIAALQTGLADGARVIDATDRLVLPGGVDSHAHIEQGVPGRFVNVDTFESGTASAAVGGTTTVICFARQGKGESLRAAVDAYHKAALRSRIDYAFHLMITDPVRDVIEQELPALVAAGNRSIKVFMTYDVSRLTDAEVLRVFAAARRLRAMVCIHAEHHDIVEFYKTALVDAGLTAPKYHAWSRPMLVERECTHRAIALAEALDVPIQIFHLSGAASANEVAQARARGLKVWGETCPQFLVLTADDLDRPGFEGTKYICSPALRTKDDQRALWEALRNGTINNVSSDHTPVRSDVPASDGTAGDTRSFAQVPSGIPGIAARLPIVFSEGVSRGRIDLATFAAITATNPAKLFGLWPRKGEIAVGADADLVLWDANREVTLTNRLMQHGADATPYEGLRVKGWPVITILRGSIICSDGLVTGPIGGGAFLARSEYAAIEPRNVFPVPFNPVDRVLLS